MTDKLAAVAKGSWRTTLLGLLGALAVVSPELAHALDNDPATLCNWGLVIGAVLTGLGLGAARDNRVTSEAAGAVK
jgi:hypothetical protein